MNPRIFGETIIDPEAIQTPLPRNSKTYTTSSSEILLPRRHLRLSHHFLEITELTMFYRIEKMIPGSASMRQNDP